MRYDVIKVESLQYMESNQPEPSPQPTPPPPPPSQSSQQQQQPTHSTSPSPSQLMWPPHSQSSYEINDASNSQFSEEGQQQVEYPSEAGGGVEDYSGTYSDRYQQASPINAGQMIRSIPAFDQGQDSPFSPQPSTSSGSYQVRLHPRHRIYNHIQHHHPGTIVVPIQSYERISPVDSYQQSPAPSVVEEQLHQYDAIPQLADQNDQVSSAVRLQQVHPSQSHVSLNMPSGRVSSPSTVDRGPSPSSAVASLQSQSLSTMTGRLSVSSRGYLSSDLVDSNISSLSLTHHQKDLLAEAVARNMVPNHVLSMSSQRISSPVNIIASSQSQRISSSPTSMDFSTLHNNAAVAISSLSRSMETIQNVTVESGQRSMSPEDSVVQDASSQRYSPVHLRPMPPSSPMMPSTPLAMQNYVSSSTGPMEGAPTSTMVSSGAVLDSTVDSTVETTDSQLGAPDEVVGSSSAAYMEDLDAGDGTIETTQSHLTMSDAIDTTDGIDTTVNTTTLNTSPNTVNKIMQLHSMLRQDNFHNSAVSLTNSVSPGLLHHQSHHMDTVAMSRPRRQLSKQRLSDQEQHQQQRNSRIVYSNKEYWCEDCSVVYDTECLQHRVQSICDKPVLSRAWASLPVAYLGINKVGMLENGESIYGVFAKKAIPKRTKFGPVEGVITKLDEVVRDDLVLQIETELGELMHLDTTDEGMSNWMRFVRPADNYSEHNLVVIQCEQSLYYFSTRHIMPRTELKVSYSQQYAERRGLKLIEPDEEELRAMEDQENAWPCFECNKPFSSSVELQKHLNEHDSGEMNLEEDASDSSPRKKTRPRGRPPKKTKSRLPKKYKSHDDLQVALDTLDEATVEALARRPRGRPPKKFRVALDTLEEASNQALPQTPSSKRPRGRPPKKFKLRTPSVIIAAATEKSEVGEFQCGVCHKVFPRQYSLQRHTIMHSGEKRFKCPICEMKFSHVYNRNRHVRRHKTRSDSEQLARPIKSLFKKKQAEGTVWICTHCDLTFDNSSLLNLHILTHAAENVGLEEVARFAVEPNFTMKNGMTDGSSGDGNDLKGEFSSDLSVATTLKCPQCTQEFATKKELIEHASAHGKMIMRRSFRGMINPAKPYKCELCYKSFASEERLLRHNLVHGSEDTKPLQCEICYKRFLNNSALACHIKVHSGDEKKYYECPICKEGFDQIILLKDHVHIHCISGVYTCPSCQKGFEEYNQIRKHIRAFHSEKRYPCEQCDKIFPRPDKLKLHMLRHSDHREFLCANCGKQFKRKDKLKEHMKRMHSAEREARLAMKPHRQPSSKKFIPKVSPTDYHRFIYKCHSCLLGFKRRGMLVNHLAKRHPEIRPESVPELNLPILKTTRDYYCQYCEKVYKSSSKRKAHILKNHPGAELPMSNRRKGGIPEIPGLPNPTFSQTVGSITTHPHNCDWCHKQYASKAKLLQHQRKKHLELLPQVESGCFQPRQIPRNHHHHQQQRDLSGQYQVQITTASTVETDYIEAVVVDNNSTRRKVSTPAPRPPSVYIERDASTPTIPPHTSVDSLQADLLTQAMSELTQSFTEYRPSTTDYHMTRMSQSEPSTLVTPSPATTPIPQSSTPNGTSMVDNSQLGQMLVHYQSQATQEELSPGTQQQSPSPSENSAQQANYVPRNWTTTFANYPAR